MLTQFELLGGTGVCLEDDEGGGGGGMSVSPLDGLADYPMDRSDFGCVGSEVYYPQPDLDASLLGLPPSPAPPPTAATPFALYDPPTSDIGAPLDFDEGGFHAEALGAGFGVECDTPGGDIEATLWTNRNWEEGTGKGKIGPLQRRALDSIFSVTEKPSRGLVLHIASELGLHHLTVKNFFSNGRRRLRRAAARLSDPERTRRENERRKEKRRLAALAASSAAAGGGERGSAPPSRMVAAPPLTPPADSPPSRDSAAPVLSPERKALMEKLADKVQRSVAQRCLASEMAGGTSSSSSSSVAHFFPQAPHHHDILGAPADILPPPSDILTTQDLVTHSPEDFLAEATEGESDSSPLLQPHIDPWNLF